MAVALAGDIKRQDAYAVYPQDVEVVAEDNGRYIQPDLTGLMCDILRVGRVLQRAGVRKIQGNRLRLAFGFGRHGAVSRINTLIAEGKLATWMAQHGLEGVKVPDEPLRLPVELMDVNAEEAFLRNISENRARNITTAIDDAHNVRRLSEQLGKSDAEICQIYARNGKPMSPAWLSQTRKILTLSNDLQRQIHDAAYAAAIAYTLADMPEEARTEVLELAKEEKAAQLASTNGVVPEKIPLTVAEVVAAGRKKGAITKQVGRKLPEVRENFEDYRDNDENPNVRKLFKVLLEWMNDEVKGDDAGKALDRAVRRYVKEP